MRVLKQKKRYQSYHFQYKLMCVIYLPCFFYEKFVTLFAYQGIFFRERWRKVTSMYKFKVSFAKQIYGYTSNTVTFLSISLILKYFLQFFNGLLFAARLSNIWSVFFVTTRVIFCKLFQKKIIFEFLQCSHSCLYFQVGHPPLYVTFSILPSVCCTPCLRKRTSSDHNFSYTYVK